MSFFIKKKNLFVVSLLVGCFAFLIYLPTLDHEFVNWDDTEYILKNENIQSLDSSSLKWMFTSFYSANWHPLTWFSHSIDYKIWGQNTKDMKFMSIRQRPVLKGIRQGLKVFLKEYSGFLLTFFRCRLSLALKSKSKSGSRQKPYDARALKVKPIQWLGRHG